MDRETTERMLTTDEAAAMMKLSPHTVRRYVLLGLMHVERQIGRSYLFRESECRRYLRERRPPGNPNLQKRRKRRGK